MNDITLDYLLTTAWAQIVARRNARLWFMATVDTHGLPVARTIVLRGAEQTRGALQFHTDLGSAKVAELSDCPQAGLVCWLPEQALQIRINAHVAVKSGAQVASIWDAVPDPSRQAYGTTPPPATPIADALAYEKRSDPAAFAVLDCVVNDIELLHLGADHRRAMYTRHGDWRGQWLAP